LEATIWFGGFEETPVTHPVRKLRRVVIQTTTLVVFVLGFIMVMGFSNQDLIQTTELSRRPAALERALAERAGNRAASAREVAIVSVSCEEDTYQVPLVNQVQMQMKICVETQAANVRDTHVQNLANQSTGTVFRLDPGMLTTDYIQIAPGANRLSVRHVLQNGERSERVITILAPQAERKPSSAD